MGKSLDEYMDQYEATRLLVRNLEANMREMGGQLSADDQKALLRVNLIMIRQCLQDFGVK